MLSLLMLAQTATAAPPPAAPKGPAQTPVYEIEVPEEAIRWGWDGTARADLTISPEGRVSACKIVQSTGHRLLDDYTCKTLMRANFTPAKDDNGKPVEGHFMTPPMVYKFSH